VRVTVGETVRVPVGVFSGITMMVCVPVGDRDTVGERVGVTSPIRVAVRVLVGVAVEVLVAVAVAA
jgi:hypothetical protein